MNKIVKGLISIIFTIIIIDISGQAICNLGQYVINDNGNTELQSIDYTSNGDYVIAGRTSSAGAGQEDVFVTRFDSVNNIVWSKTYGTSSEETGYPIKIIKTSNGFLISTSSFAYNPSVRVLVVLNIDNNGNILWQKRINNTSGYSDSREIFEDNQGNYIISGSKVFNTQGLDDVYIIKLDNLGNTIWTYTYGTSMQDHSFKIIQTSDNGYLSVGSSTFSGIGQTSKLLIKLDVNGNFQWSKFIDGVNYDNIYDIDMANDGSLFTFGIEGDLGDFECSLTKISSTGSVLWSKTLGGSGNDNASCINIDNQGNLYISGFSNSFGSGSNNLFLSKLDNQGNEIWTKFYGGTSNESHYGTANNMTLDTINNKIYLFANSLSFGSNNSDPYIVVTDLEGNSDCNSLDVNWTVTTTNPTSGNAPGVSGTFGTLVNSNFVSSNFIFSMDTICTTIRNDTLPSLNTCSNGQYFLDDNGQTQVQAILHTNDDGYITAGYTNSSGAGQEDIFVIKFDSQNKIEWSNTYGTSSSEKGFGLGLTKTSTGFALCFNSAAYAISHGALTVLNLDFNGAILWQKKLDLPNIYSHGRYIIEDNQNNFLVIGNVSDNNDDAYIVKLDNSGNMLWSKKFSSPDQDQVHKIIQTPDNGYIFGANSKGQVGNLHSKHFIKIDNSGNLDWSKYYTSGINEQFNDFILSLDGNIIAVGRDIGANDNIGLTKLDLSGNIIWSKRFTGSGTDRAFSIKELTDGSIYISGFSDSQGNGGDDFFLTKFDANGSEIWTNFYGGSFNENTYQFGANCMDINVNENKIYIAGKTNSFGGSDVDPYILITDLDGSSDCNSVSGNWTQSNVSLNSFPAAGTLTNLGSMSNSSLVLNPFILKLDTICVSFCDTSIINPIDSLIDDSNIISICNINLPSAFSPNADGINDFLFPIIDKNEPLEIKTFRIYNRWGEEIHNSISPWDGKYKGKDQALETYVYYVEYICNNETKKLIGNVSIVR